MLVVNRDEEEQEEQEEALEEACRLAKAVPSTCARAESLQAAGDRRGDTIQPQPGLPHEPDALVFVVLGPRRRPVRRG